MPLLLPDRLADALWAHAIQQAPSECVGALGGHIEGDWWHVHALYPLPNVSANPQQEYQADPGRLLRALRVMSAQQQTLVALYHSHPRGPALPSLTDTRLAAYPVPYLIADLHSRTLSAYQLPAGTPVEVVVGHRRTP